MATRACRVGFMNAKIGVMGAQGSFSEEAGRTYAMKEKLEKPELVYLVNAEMVLSALEAAEIDIAVFPIENSNGGIVIEAVYAMAKHRFDIKKLFEIDVRHNLLVKPGAHAGNITEITSHDQALKQCRMYLKRIWTGVEIREYPDTAKAAADLASGVLPPTTAVIAARVAYQYRLRECRHRRRGTTRCTCLL